MNAEQRETLLDLLCRIEVRQVIPDSDGTITIHAGSIADALTPLIDGMLAEAWDESRRTNSESWASVVGWAVKGAPANERPRPAPVNPYRKATT